MNIAAIQADPVTVVIEEKPEDPRRVEYVRKKDVLAAIGAWRNSPAGDRAYQEVEQLPTIVISEEET